MNPQPVTSGVPAAPRPGSCLRQMRMRLGLTARKVAELSGVVAREQGNPEYALSHARLLQIEKEQSVPSVYKLFSLSSIYGVTFAEILSCYMDLGSAGRLHDAMQLGTTHLPSLNVESTVRPLRFAPSFGGGAPEQTGMLTREQESGGGMASALLDHLARQKARFGYIGLSDYTMYPLIRPGSVVQIDTAQRSVRSGNYSNEFERPIYFLELHSGYLCSWCDIGAGRLISIPHPLSTCAARVFAYPSQVEIVGRVTGVSMRLLPREEVNCGARLTSGSRPA